MAMRTKLALISKTIKTIIFSSHWDAKVLDYRIYLKITISCCSAVFYHGNKANKMLKVK
jgi:hypothetical protein